MTTGTWRVVFVTGGNNARYDRTYPGLSTDTFSWGLFGDAACGSDPYSLRQNSTPIACSGSPGNYIESAVFTSNEPPTPTDKYDCINKNCFKSTQYNTPGIFQSLGDCEENCGSGCSGVCISNGDWATIQGLASQHLSKDCG